MDVSLLQRLSNGNENRYQSSRSCASSFTNLVRSSSSTCTLFPNRVSALSKPPHWHSFVVLSEQSTLKSTWCSYIPMSVNSSAVQSLAYDAHVFFPQTLGMRVSWLSARQTGIVFLQLRLWHLSLWL